MFFKVQFTIHYIYIYIHFISKPRVISFQYLTLYTVIFSVCLLISVLSNPCDKWVPVNTARRVTWLRMEERPPIWRVASNILVKQSQVADMAWSSSLGFGRSANNSSTRKRIFVTKYSQTKPRTWTGPLVRPKQRKKDMRVGTWNV
jgi:hypothetical protein